MIGKHVFVGMEMSFRCRCDNTSENDEACDGSVKSERSGVKRR